MSDHLFRRPILYLFGASDATFPYANDYLTVYVLGTVFVMIGLGMNPFINAQGFSRTGMLTVALGAVVNIVLDPIFIFGFDMGARGAALATVISQGCSAVWVLKFLTGKKAILRLRLSALKLLPLHPPSSSNPLTFNASTPSTERNDSLRLIPP